MPAQPSFPHSLFASTLADPSYHGAEASSQAIEIREVPAKPHSETPVAKDIPWIPIGFWGIAMLLTLFVFEAAEVKALSRHLFTRLRLPKKAPCTNCTYFSDNVYLKCTVRPTDVLTERAVDCKDFCARSPKLPADINPPKS